MVLDRNRNLWIGGESRHRGGKEQDSKGETMHGRNLVRVIIVMYD
jgi:hypothetical protein